MKIIDFYNFSNDKSYLANRIIDPREIVAVSIINKHFPNGGVFADIGCGNGSMLRCLNEQTNLQISYIGFDYSSFQLGLLRSNKLKSNIKVLKTIQGNLEDQIKLDDKSVDFIYLGEVIEHLYNPDILLQECSRILKKGGYLLLTTPNLNSWYNRILFLFGLQPIFYETSVVNAQNGFGILKRFKKSSKPVGHVRLFNRSALIDILNANKLKPVKIIGTTTNILPSIIHSFEKIFSIFPSMSSILVVLAKK